jgi:hypothetical protein
MVAIPRAPNGHSVLDSKEWILRLSAWARLPRPSLPEGQDLLPLAVLISLPVTGLCQVLRTTPGQLSADPAAAAGHWVTGSLITLPLFAAGVWAGDYAASRAGIGLVKLSDICKRALLIVLLVAVVLIPLWFERNKVDTVAQAQALVTPHSHGSVDVYWVGPGVIVALVSVCLAPAAVWAGRGIAGRLSAALPRGGRPLARVSVRLLLLSLPLLLVAFVPAAAWWLQHTAQHAYASQVDNTGALLAAHIHSHAFFGAGHGSRALTGPPVTAAPFAFAYQLAHALQDGLAGQAAGFPAAVIALLWGTRGMRGHGRYQQAAS